MFRLLITEFSAQFCSQKNDFKMIFNWCARTHHFHPFLLPIEVDAIMNRTYQLPT